MIFSHYLKAVPNSASRDENIIFCFLYFLRRKYSQAEIFLYPFCCLIYLNVGCEKAAAEDVFKEPEGFRLRSLTAPPVPGVMIAPFIP